MASDQPTWARVTHTRWAWVLFALFLVGGVVVGLSDAWPATVVLFVAAVAMLAFTRVTVECGPGGMTLRYGPGWPVQRFPLERIEAARAIDLADLTIDRALWGYKGSLRVLGRAQLNLRRGPAIELDLAHGRRFSVTVEDPDTGAAVINHALGIRAH